MPGKTRIAVVGAGLGGATVGGLLQQAGFQVDIYEQASAFDRIGAGIHLTANVMKILSHLGVEERLSETGIHPDSFVSRKWDTGEVLFELPLGAEGERRYGATYITVHRGDLHAALVSTVAPEAIHSGKKLVDIDRSKSPMRLKFADGDVSEADLIIGADGVNSKVREIVVSEGGARYTGHVAHRAIYPYSLLNDMEVRNCTKWWGPKSHILIYYITKSRDEIYFVTSVPEPNWTGTSSWISCDPAEMKALFDGFHPEVRRVVETAPEVTKWPIFDREAIERWSVGPIVLLGDACHAMRPYMAQGAAMAIEDAAILARCLEGAHDGDFADAIGRYEKHRIPRATKVQEVSLSNSFLRGPTETDWVFGYDAFAEDLS